MTLMDDRGQPMYYAETQPSARLKPYVAAYWHFRVAEGAGEIEHTVPLTGGLLLSTSASRDQLVLYGPRLVPLRPRVRAGDVYWGAHFWPGAGAALLGTGAAGLRDQAVPAAQRLDRVWAERLAAALASATTEAEAAASLDTALASLQPRAEELDGPVMTAVFRIIRNGGRGPIGELPASVGLSPRQFRRRFRAAVELSAKELARLRRMRASAADAVTGPQEPWVQVAAEHGYADQAHLAREFRRLVGLSPAAFERHVRRIEHARLVGPPEE
jgi:AraC-like DNA-binding protein